MDSVDDTHKTLAQKRAEVIPLYIYVAMLYLAVFVPLFTFVIKNPSLIIVHLIDVVIITWCHIYFRKTHNINRVSFAMCCIAFLTVASVMVTGGVENSGPFLAFAYIPFVVFVRPLKSATRWIFGLLIFMLAALLFDTIHLIELPYSFITFTLYMFNYIIALLLTLSYAREKEFVDSTIAENIKATDLINDQLSDAIASQKQSLNELKKKSVESERLNALMVGREVKMIELKKELKKTKRP